MEIASTTVQGLIAFGLLVYMWPELRRDLQKHWYVLLISIPVTWYISKGLAFIVIPNLDLSNQTSATQAIGKLLPYVLFIITYMGIARVAVNINDRIRGLRGRYDSSKD